MWKWGGGTVVNFVQYTFSRIHHCGWVGGREEVKNRCQKLWRSLYSFVWRIFYNQMIIKNKPLVKWYVLTIQKPGTTYRIYLRISRPAFKSNWKKLLKFRPKLEFLKTSEPLWNRLKLKNITKNIISWILFLWPAYKSNE